MAKRIPSKPSCDELAQHSAPSPSTGEGQGEVDAAGYDFAHVAAGMGAVADVEPDPTGAETEAAAETVPAIAGAVGPASDRPYEERGIRTRSLDCPLGDPELPGYTTRHIDAQLDASQARAMRALYQGLKVQGATLASGRPVASGPDAIRWLLDQLASESSGQDDAPAAA